jgi:hypothetical protein
MANKKDADVAVEMLRRKLSDNCLPPVTIGVGEDSLIIYTDRPKLFGSVLVPETCGGWKIRVVKTSQPRPAGRP